MLRPLVCWLLCLLPALVMAQDEPLRLAFKGELLSLNKTQLLAREPLPDTLQTPLGSVWKLFVYGWLVDIGAREPAYECRGQSKEEVYCCSAGGRIERDQALVKSCGLYFEPAHLGIVDADWRAYWQSRQAPEWLLNLSSLQPGTRVSVAELLRMLAVMPAQEQARRVLLDVVLNAADGNVVGELGSRLRVKTWSWLGDQDPASRQGGFAGWTADGSPIWAGGRGTSQRVLRDHAVALSAVVPVLWPIDAGRCVEVGLFSRYPLERVLSGSREVGPGQLRGDLRVEFANGNQLDIHSDGELFLLKDKLVARLDREEYVARVLQREATPEPVEAAKALAVAIRTYLLQNATRHGECLSIDDSSQRQRVAPRPASAEARLIAAWTSDLVLAGSSVTYHSDQPGPDKLSWQQAVEQARAGQRYDAILLHAYPRASLSRWDNPVASCEALPAAQDWLQKQRRGWRPKLESETGYNEVSTFAVCRLAFGRPYVDRERQRIYVRGVLSLQDRLDLTHEYLHLAFEAHPNGQDETYIEGLARHLLLE
ncbi:TPA: YfaQ family protein [Pseudomonas putida]|nr:YfaQ family protein [Pseudomonas putida]